MEYETNSWVSRSLREGDPRCLETPEELLLKINTIGFLPLFSNSVPGFSVEEMTSGVHWWSGDEKDPWEWREILSATGEVAYGKFFAGRAGYISLDWFPVFANWRRDGYDFDSMWDEGLATIRQKKIMDVLTDQDPRFSFELKNMAGFGKGGEKNFDGTLSQLENLTYVVIKEFRQKLNKKGEPYGWNIAVLTTPESLWGYDMVTSEYGTDPEASKKKIYDRISRLYDISDTEILKKVLG